MSAQSQNQVLWADAFGALPANLILLMLVLAFLGIVAGVAAL